MSGPAADPPRVPAALTRLEDAELAAMVAGGDRDGVAALHDRYVGRVYDFVYRTLRSRPEAAAVTRAVMVDALTDLLLHPMPSHGVRGAFCSTARARVVERLGLTPLRRGETRAVSDAESEQVGLDQLGPGWTTAGDGSASAEAARNVWHNAAALPLRHYIVLDLHLRQGLSGEALAESLGVSPPIAEHALVEAGRAFLAASAPVPLPSPPPPSGETDDEGSSKPEEPIGEDVVWQMLGGYVEPADVAKLDASSEGQLLSHLAPVPMPVELKNAIWRDLAARWPDPDEHLAPGAERPGPRTVEATPPPAPAVPESPATLADTAPISLAAAFGSRPGDQLLARTRDATIRGDAEPGAYGGLIVDENALPPLRSPVRLRPRGDRGLPLLVVMVLALFVAGLLVGVAIRGPELAAAYLSASISLPQLTLPGSGGGATPTPPATPTGEVPPTATVPAATPPPGTPPSAAAAAAADTPTPVPTTPAPPTNTPPPTPTQTGTATPTGTVTPTATATAPPAPTDTPVPPTNTPVPPTNTPVPPPATATRPPPTNTPRPPPPPPPPTQTPTPPPPTDTPAPPTATPGGRGVLVPIQVTPRR